MGRRAWGAPYGRYGTHFADDLRNDLRVVPGWGGRAVPDPRLRNELNTSSGLVTCSLLTPFGASLTTASVVYVTGGGKRGHFILCQHPFR